MQSVRYKSYRHKKEHKWRVQSMRSNTVLYQPTGNYKADTMKTIYKYHIPFGNEVTVQMPKNAELYKFGLQGIVNGHPDICVWALVDTETEITDRKFRIFGTGHPIPDNCISDTYPDMQLYVYYDTIFDRGMVWHIFAQLWLDN